MSDIWSIFMDRINRFNQNIIRYFTSITKSFISYSKFFSKSSINKFEIKKLNWELKKENERLGKYIYQSKLNNIYDFSNEAEFHKIIDRIKEIKNFLKSKKNNI